MSKKDAINLEQMRARYKELCERRDAVNKVVDPLRAKRAEAVARAEKAKLEAEELTRQITDARGGGEAWIALKKEIGLLARVVG